jgi:hypothetical protein
MIPQLVTVRCRRPDGRRLRIYVPVMPVLLVLLPLLLLAELAGLVTCLSFRLGPVRALSGTGHVLWGLPGVRFEIERGRTAVSVSVR